MRADHVLDCSQGSVCTARRRNSACVPYDSVLWAWPHLLCAFVKVFKTLLTLPDERSDCRLAFGSRVIYCTRLCMLPAILLPPGVLGELAALAEVLDRSPDWKSDAVGVRARMLAILGDVAERYLQQGTSRLAHCM